MRLTVVLLALVGCKSGITLNELPNQAPYATITTPSTDFVAPEGEVVSFSGLVADEDGAGDIVTVTWTSSIDGVLADGDLAWPDEGGETGVSTALSVGTHVVTLQVTDQGGLSGRATVGVTIEDQQQEPIAEIIEPETFAEFLDDEEISFTGVVTDKQDDADSIYVSWNVEPTEGGDTIEVAAGYASATGTSRATWADPEPGNWLVTLVATDGDENVGRAQIYIVVGDALAQDEDGDGYSFYDGDCNDSDASMSPGNEEVCGNGKDDDCSGNVDDRDVDGDDHVDSDCTLYDGPHPIDDCDDTLAEVYPGQPDAPDLSYIDANCDGIDGDLLDAVFVDATSGKDSNAGITPAAPVKSLDQAYAVASGYGLGWILIASGSPKATSGAFVQGIGLAGGYRSDAAWARDVRVVPTLSMTSSGIALSGWSTATEWQQIAVTSASATAAGGSSTALRLENVTNFTLSACTITAGSGYQGSAGSNGSNGSNAYDGSKGGNGVEQDDYTGFPLYCSKGSDPSVGSGGYGCNYGGSGGSAGHGDSDHGSKSGSTGSTGKGTGGGTGGSGGSLGNNGSTGSNGSAGSDGTNGSGGGTFGSVAYAGYSVSSGSSGTAGSSGAGGGGGGGGGGGDAPSYECYSTGGAGGGGGGGGCYGSAGTGGGGGGASIAIIATGTTDFTLSESEVVTGNGGAGGAGGTGGNGGTGGSGGSGGANEDTSGSGGTGGSGGAGGDGGHGGGGGGGPSIGIACSGAKVTIDTATLFTIGSGGTGGASSGDAGDNGAEAEADGCL